MANDVIFNKIAIMERCLIRVKEVYNDNTENLKDFTKQDAIILNIQRACEAALQLAMHIVSDERLGLPQSSEDAFDRLLEEDIISQRTVIRLREIIEFKNSAVRHYPSSLNLDRMKSVIENHLDEFTAYKKEILNYLHKSNY
ncbi:hypothetical protein J18TS1_18920 [Oceanobacillus oncorhynchi subsp. incaldanensis]|uniref:DUF86 domain-containing protein n=2 Tax=Oceanobacillus TaxID=182709 RepID=A0A0A1MAK8_9BACI|nr:DUF86 domain-containing protein [Oceanobacillus oncorhynchi]GIO18792.1 hypothetical protein J18TS1_18920 [Oceanobacillus oncorhynchi subsp. incaldanensis]CEI82365.1 hypothetical protein BN997_02229 [Oceanobacillus oncorhynchi]